MRPLLLSAAAMLLGLAAPATAQDGAAPPPQTPAAQAETPVSAPAAAAPATTADPATPSAPDPSAIAAAAQLMASATGNPDYIWNLDLSSGGRVQVQLAPWVAPAHVERIRTLTRQGFYNGLKFHRVIDGFMAQTGDPVGDGTGGSPLPDLKAEFNGNPHLRGVVSMARAESVDSANSQFFIMFQPRFQLDRKYTNFGRVIAGMQFVDAIARGEPPEVPDTIIQASIAADNRPAPDFAPYLARRAAAAAAAPAN